MSAVQIIEILWSELPTGMSPETAIEKLLYVTKPTGIRNDPINQKIIVTYSAPSPTKLDVIAALETPIEIVSLPDENDYIQLLASKYPGYTPLRVFVGENREFLGAVWMPEAPPLTAADFDSITSEFQKLRKTKTI